METRQHFRELHDGSFIMPNPWDVGSARILASLGFPALATTSAGHAATLGKRDGEVTREEAIAHARVIVDATPAVRSRTTRATRSTRLGSPPIACGPQSKRAAGRTHRSC